MDAKGHDLERQLAEALATVVAAQLRIEELEDQLATMREDLAEAGRLAVAAQGRAAKAEDVLAVERALAKEGA
jgi:hypothetical protein